MACEIQIKTNWSRGGGHKYDFSPIRVRQLPHTGWGLKEVPSFGQFVYARVTDADEADVQNMIQTHFGEQGIEQPWIRKLLFEKQGENLSIDGYRYKASAANPGLSNQAGITKDMIETYLNKWNGFVDSFAINEVIFDFAVYEDDRDSQNIIPGVLQSNGFWGYNVSFVSFHEVLYTQATGVHRIQADYSGSIPMSDRPDKVASVVYKRKGTIHSNADGVIEFSIQRNDVFRYFKQDVDLILESKIYDRQFRFLESTVDLISGNGGFMDVTLNQL